jgi:hypothetical protein
LNGSSNLNMANKSIFYEKCFSRMLRLASWAAIFCVTQFYIISLCSDNGTFFLMNFLPFTSKPEILVYIYWKQYFGHYTNLQNLITKSLCENFSISSMWYLCNFDTYNLSQGNRFQINWNQKQINILHSKDSVQKYLRSI